MLALNLTGKVPGVPGVQQHCLSYSNALRKTRVKNQSWRKWNVKKSRQKHVYFFHPSYPKHITEHLLCSKGRIWRDEEKGGLILTLGHLIASWTERQGGADSKYKGRNDTTDRWIEFMAAQGKSKHLPWTHRNVPIELIVEIWIRDCQIEKESLGCQKSVMMKSTFHNQWEFMSLLLKVK